MSLVYRIHCLFDPAQNYMRRQSDAGFGRSKPPDGSTRHPPVASFARVNEVSAPSWEKMESWDEETQKYVTDLKAAQSETVRTRGPLLRSSAQEVLDSEVTSIETDAGIVAARLTRFWNGKAVFETSHVGPGCSGGSMTEVPRSQPNSSLVEMIEKELVRAIAELDADGVRRRDMDSPT